MNGPAVIEHKKSIIQTIGRLVLGTAQFGLNYGITNKSGQVPLDEVSSILKFASEAGIVALDTAWAYGASEAVLGEVGIGKFDVISKVTKIPANVADSELWLSKNLENSLARLGLSSIKTLLLHNPADILGPKGDGILRALLRAKQSGQVSQIGFSIYSPDELYDLNSIFQPDVVQVPYNIFDRRMVNSGWLSKLKDSGVEVHSRSTFLQGALLAQPRFLPSALDPWKGKIAEFQDWAEQTGCSPIEAALGFSLSAHEIDKVLVGVESLKQIQQIASLVHTLPVDFPDFSSIEESLINPSRWVV